MADVQPLSVSPSKLRKTQWPGSRRPLSGTCESTRWVLWNFEGETLSGWKSAIMAGQWLGHSLVWLRHGSNMALRECWHKPQQCQLSNWDSVSYAGRCRHGGEPVFGTPALRVSCRATGICDWDTSVSSTHWPVCKHCAVCTVKSAVYGASRYTTVSILLSLPVY